MRTAIILTLMLAVSPLFAAIEYKPAYRIVVKTLPEQKAVEADVSTLLADLKTEQIAVTTEAEQFVVVVTPKKGKKLRESEFREAFNSSVFEFVSFKEHEIDPNGELKLPQMSAKDLGRLEWDELVVPGRTWVVQVTTGNDSAEAVTHERWTVTAVDEKGADIEMLMLDETGKYVMLGKKPLPYKRRLERADLESAETANLATEFGKMVTLRVTDVTVKPNGTCKDETTVTKWYTKGAGFLLRDEDSWKITGGGKGDFKLETSGRHSLREVIEMSE